MNLASSLRRAALLVTAVVCLLGQTAALAHLALVRHATCPAHEDGLVHAQSPAGPIASPQRPQAAGQRPSAGASDDGGGHQDDHCLAAALRGSGLLVVSAGAEQRLDVHAPPRLPVATADPRHPVPLLRLAPKSSPPATIA